VQRYEVSGPAVLRSADPGRGVPPAPPANKAENDFPQRALPADGRDAAPGAGVGGEGFEPRLEDVRVPSPVGVVAADELPAGQPGLAIQLFHGAG
jgi:hypothetical protein